LSTVSAYFHTAGMKSSVRHHYRGGKIALWLDLIPRLHKSDNLDARYHLLDDSDNLTTFEDEGTRPIDWLDTLSTPSIPTTLISYTTQSLNVTRLSTPTAVSAAFKTSNTIKQRRSTAPTTLKSSSEKPGHELHTVTSVAHIARDGSMSLGITIAVGCSLLLLNVLVFVAVFHQKGRVRRERRLIKLELEQEQELFLNLNQNQNHHQQQQQHQQQQSDTTITICSSKISPVNVGQCTLKHSLNGSPNHMTTTAVGNHNNCRDGYSLTPNVMLETSCFGQRGRGETLPLKLPRHPPPAPYATLAPWPPSPKKPVSPLQNHVTCLDNGRTVKHTQVDNDNYETNTAEVDDFRTACDPSTVVWKLNLQILSLIISIPSFLLKFRPSWLNNSKSFVLRRYNFV